MRKDNKRTIALYMFPAILMIVVLLYLPIFINLYESFFSWGAMSSSHKFVGIGNYMKMFKDEVFYTALKNNMIFMIMSVIFQIGLSLLPIRLNPSLCEKHRTFFSQFISFLHCLW